MKTIIEAVEEAQRVLAQYLEPDSLRSTAGTIHRLVTVLDRPELVAAIERMKASRGEVTREQKITLGEMREMGVRALLVYCSDFHCSHSVAISGNRWSDDVRLSDLEPDFICHA